MIVEKGQKIQESQKGQKIQEGQKRGKKRMNEKKTIMQQVIRPMGLIGLIGLVGLLGLLGGCTSEVQEGQESRQTLELVPFSSSFFEVEPMGTRAGYLPDGYVPYGSLYETAPLNTDIGIWMTPENTGTPEDFIYKSGSDWKSTAIVVAGKTYYIYGFMPHTAGNVSITSLNNDYANGASITLTDYPTVTENDICAIVGLRKKTGTESITALEADVLRGKFEYTANGSNTVFLLMKHLYAALQFSARLDPEYYKVRDINITKVELIGNSIPQTGDLKVTLTANTTGADPSAISFDTTGKTTGDVTATLYQKSDSPTDKGHRLSTVAKNFLGCFAFGSICRNFTLKTTYDVYDKKDNLIRKGCVAENKIDIREMFSIEEYQTIDPGTKYTINLLVEPTYLYVLSEPDIDNPKITVSN